MILVKDKWDTYVVDNDRGDEWAALDILRKRVEDGFWYDDYNDGNPAHNYATRAKKIVTDEDAHGALAFLLQRREAEYEWIEIQSLAQ